MSMHILTGNELTSGATVYLAADNSWVEDLQAARLFTADEAEARDAALAASKGTGRIIGPDIEQVDLIDGHILPRRLRERIRAAGPTAPLGRDGRGFPRQSLGEDGHVSI